MRIGRNKTGVNPPLATGKMKTGSRITQKGREIKNALGSAYYATGKIYLESFMDKELKSGTVRQMSKEEIAALEGQYTTKAKL
jgi:hypothetical protein